MDNRTKTASNGHVKKVIRVLQNSCEPLQNSLVTLLCENNVGNVWLAGVELADGFWGWSLDVFSKALNLLGL